jgi:hypothetical protein
MGIWIVTRTSGTFSRPTEHNNSRWLQSLRLAHTKQKQSVGFQSTTTTTHCARRTQAAAEPWSSGSKKLPWLRYVGPSLDLMNKQRWNLMATDWECSSQMLLCQISHLHDTFFLKKCCKTPFRCLLVRHILRRRTLKSLCLDTGFFKGVRQNIAGL